MSIHPIITALLALLLSSATAAEPLRLAVAANFREAATALVENFIGDSEWEATLQVASTGVLYAQISNGAPFDVFLAADTERPRMLEKNGLTINDSRIIYAWGELVLVPASGGEDWTDGLKQKNVRLVIANPDTAPYGTAAQQALDAKRIKLSRYGLIRAANVAQAYQIWDTGNVDFALVSRAQARQVPYTIIPHELYRPIEQQAVQLKRATHPAATEFMRYLLSARAQKIIAAHGYLTESPGAQ